MAENTIIFYDGSCGLCHFFVRFTLPRMDQKRPFIFCPIGGKTCRDLLKDHPTLPLSDSIMVYEKKGKKILLKGEAVIFILSSLTPGCKMSASLLRRLPRWMVDGGYVFVSKIRHLISKKTKTTCPSVAAELQRFFQD